MGYGYNTYIALTLAMAACCNKAKAQAPVMEKSPNRIEIQNNLELPADTVSTISFNEAREDYVSNHILNERDAARIENETAAKVMTVAENDSILQEKIYQSIVDIEPDLMRFLSLSENIKFQAYYDRSGRKWTIGNGLTTLSCGRAVRKGDYFFSEDEMRNENLYKIKKDIVPLIAKYLPRWLDFDYQQKLVLLDMFWNNGAGQGVLTNGPSKDAYFKTLSEAQKQEIADMIKNNNQKVVDENRVYSLNDLPEWRNLNVFERTFLSSMYANNNLVKGTDVNFKYGEKWGTLMDFQRREVTELLQQKQRFSEFSAPGLPNRFGAQNVNDSTVLYRNFLNEQSYNLSEIPAWYKLSEKKQEEITQKLADANNKLEHNGHIVAAKSIPAWYFLSTKEKKILHSVFKGLNLIRKDAKNNINPILSGLCCELNLYLADKTPENLERATARIASFVYCKGEVLTGLLKRANLRAKLFSGEIKFGSEGDNSIDLSQVVIGATAACNKKDLTNEKALCEALNNCKIGKTYDDTIRYEQTRISKIRKGPQNRPSVKTGYRIRIGARSH